MVVPVKRKKRFNSMRRRLVRSKAERLKRLCMLRAIYKSAYHLNGPGAGVELHN